MDNIKKDIKYFLYARKSSENEDRQIQSIDDQINRLKEFADSFNLNILKIFEESKSAKNPGDRPVFEDMISRIESGEAQGILCWKLNRLTRNPIDTGRLSWLLQSSIIKSIKTTERNYLPGDNVLLFSVDGGMANQFILDLSKDVKRGMINKLKQGWSPNRAPIGYLNDRENKIITIDPERFGI
jgi:site-specific DNA recombinase